MRCIEKQQKPLEDKIKVWFGENMIKYEYLVHQREHQQIREKQARATRERIAAMREKMERK